ncbi:hypothetical protein HK405_005953 [Cladochytrium tenue]|nr:hypothetical protein HK405_005953 [Cladochytrium tenue]
MPVSHFLVASIRSTRRGSPSVVMEIPLVLVAIRRDNSLLRRAIQLNAVVDDDERENMRRASLDTLPLYEPPPVTESQALAAVDEDAEGDNVVAALEVQDDSDSDDEESPTTSPPQQRPPSPDAHSDFANSGYFFIDSGPDGIIRVVLFVCRAPFTTASSPAE